MDVPNNLVIGNYYVVQRSDGTSRFAELIEIRKQGDSDVDEYYVHYEGCDRRFDEWVSPDKIDLSSRKVFLSPEYELHRRHVDVVCEFARENQTSSAKGVKEFLAEVTDVHLYRERKRREKAEEKIEGYEQGILRAWKEVARMMATAAAPMCIDIFVPQELKRFFREYAGFAMIQLMNEASSSHMHMEGYGMGALQDFNKAAENVGNLKEEPSDEELLELYALFKQAISYNKGIPNEGSQKKYIQAVLKLVEEIGLN